MSRDLVVQAVFAFVYAGMILGRIPGLALVAAAWLALRTF
jgi:hypothetical protein